VKADFLAYLWPRRRAGGELGRLSAGAALAFAIQSGGLVAGYVSNIALARWLGNTEYGVYSYAVSWSLILGTLAALELPTVMLRFVPHYWGRQEWSYVRGFVRGAAAICGLTGTGIAVAGTAWLMWRHPSQEVQTGHAITLALWLAPLWALLFLQTAWGRVLRRITIAYAPARLFRPLALLAAAGLLHMSGIPLTGTRVVALAIATVAVTVAGQWLVLRVFTPRQIKQSTPGYQFDVWLRVAPPLLLTAVMVLVSRESGILLIGTLLDAGHVGIFNAAGKTAGLLTFPVSAVVAVAAPVYAAHHAAGRQDRLQRMVSFSAIWGFLPALAMGLVLAVAAPRVLGLFGPEFRAAESETMLLAIAALVAAAAGPALILLNVTGHQQRAAGIMVVCSLITVAFTWIGIVWWGITGAAAASVAGALVQALWLNRAVTRSLGIRPSIFGIFRSRDQART
jgi:O-antigen/teichoic acid export membrane protein